MSTVNDLLGEGSASLTAAGIDAPRFEARLLLEAVTGRDRTRLAVASGESVREAEVRAFRAMLRRRAEREPIAYILGRAEFWSLEFAVGLGVLIPRPDTETLIECALRRFPDRHRPLRLLDIGTGSGCLALTLLHLFASATAIATDVSQLALGWAARNARKMGVGPRVELIESQWASAASGTFDLVVSNPPYVATDDIRGLMPDVGSYEPRLALDGGPDGLAAYRAILADLPRLLTPSGCALLEVGDAQAGKVRELARTWRVTIHQDLAGIERCVELARRSPAA